MNTKEEKIKQKIIKLHNKYHKMQNKPSKISMYAFMPLTALIAFSLAFLSGTVLYIPVLSALLIFGISIGATMGLVYNFSKDFNETRLEKVMDKLVKLENKLCEQYNFSKEGNILYVPEGKTQEYVNGEYVLTQCYHVLVNDDTTIFTKEEIEDYRQKGYEFCKKDTLLKMLDPREVKICKQNGYTFEREKDTIASLILKDGVVINGFNYSIIGVTPAYNLELDEKETEFKNSLIQKMLANYNKKSKEPIKGNETVEFINDCEILGRQD